MLRLEGDATFAPDKTDVTVNILVPSDLPRQPHDLVLVAELLSPDGKNVVTSLAYCRCGRSCRSRPSIWL